MVEVIFTVMENGNSFSNNDNNCNYRINKDSDFYLICNDAYYMQRCIMYPAGYHSDAIFMI